MASPAELPWIFDDPLPHVAVPYGQTKQRDRPARATAQGSSWRKNKALALVVLLTMEGAAHADTPKTPPYAVTSLGAWPPYFLEGENTQPGIGGDVLAICVSETGYQPKYVKFSLKRMHISLRDGSVDFNIMSYKKEREEYIHYSKVPIFKEYYKPFVRHDSKIVIHKIEDFNNLRLGHRAGLQYSPEFTEYVQKREKDKTLDTVDMDKLNILKLLAKRIDIFVNTASTVHWLIKEMGKASLVKELDYVIRSSEYFVTVSKKSRNITDPKDFLQKIDACLLRLKSDGTMDKITKKYSI